MPPRIKYDPEATDAMLRRGLGLAADIGTRALLHGVDSVLGDVARAVGGASAKVARTRRAVRSKLRDITPQAEDDGDDSDG